MGEEDGGDIGSVVGVRVGEPLRHGKGPGVGDWLGDRVDVVGELDVGESEMEPELPPSPAPGLLPSVLASVH